MPQGFLTLQSTATIFTPSVGAAANARTMGTGFGSIVNLPAVDSGNTSMTLTNTGSEPVAVSFGRATPKRFTDAVGTSEVIVPVGGPYLLTGPAFSAAGAAATACIASRSGAVGIVFQRGTVSSAELFS